MKNKIGSLLVLVTLALIFHADVASAYYDPELGRFIQPDTIIPDLSNPQSYNRYSYCVNDPLRYTDPTGHGPTDYMPGIGPGIAEIQGNMALESMAHSHGYTSYAQARQALGMGQATAGNVSAVAGVGHVTAGAANAYIMGAQEIATAGMATGPVLIGRTEQALTREAETGVAKAILPDETVVVRGGQNLPADIVRGTGTHPSGVVGVSVESAEGKTAAELSKNIPHGQVGVTTVGEVRAAGGNVVQTSGRSPNHATMAGLPPEKASELLRPTIPNPAKQ